MAGVMVNDGEAIALRALVNHTAQSSDLILRLFTNNYTPIGTTAVGDLTEATGNGYASITLTGASWTITEGAPSTAVYAQREFAFTGALGNVYGYYITANGVLVNAERFTDGPYNVQNNGDTIRVTPTIRLGSVTND